MSGKSDGTGVFDNWAKPVVGKVTSKFGERENPVLGVPEFHNGVDIAVPAFTTAVAVSGGIVTDVSVSPTYGNVVKYKTDDGYEIMYAHLEKPLIIKGDRLWKGGTVAYTGATGLVTGAHLHYSVFKDGVAIEPPY